MKNTIDIPYLIRWIARIWGGLVLLLLAVFLIPALLGSIFGKAEPVGGFQNTKEVFLFICFPVSTVIGLAMAYKWEGLGGLVATSGLVVMHFLLAGFAFPDRRESVFLYGIFPVGILYIVSWLITKIRETGEIDLSKK